MNREQKADRLRRLVDELLLTEPQATLSASNLFALIISRGQARGLSFKQPSGFADAEAGRVVVEYWWRLARLGIVAIVGEELVGNAEYRVFPKCQVTATGRALLERGAASPHDPDRYFAELRARVTHVDEVALAYLSDAVREAQVYRASAVMLGCACERLVMELARVVSERVPVREAERLRKKFAGRFAPHVADVAEDVRAALAGLSLPRELDDGLDRKLVSIFEYARALRNKSGHPTGEHVSEEEAQAGLLLFPSFYAFVDAPIAHLMALEVRRSWIEYSASG